MKKRFGLLACLWMLTIIFVKCNDKKTQTSVATNKNFNGYESQAKWGEHLVIVGACNDCHSPKKMTPMGPDIDSSKLLAGHIAGSPEPDVSNIDVQNKGLIITTDLTTWVGAWGTSYTANLTSDSTGIGNWKEEQFITALRKGKLKGLETSRDLLPPMPWQMYKNLTDDEMKAIFAYLKSTKPIKNIVPPPVPPVAK